MVELDELVRVFGRGEGAVRALDGVTLSGTFSASPAAAMRAEE